MSTPDPRAGSVIQPRCTFFVKATASPVAITMGPLNMRFELCGEVAEWANGGMLYCHDHALPIVRHLPIWVAEEQGLRMI